MQFIREYRREHGCAPSMQEVADHIGLTKTPTYQRMVRLRARNLVDFAEGKARTLMTLSMEPRTAKAEVDTSGMDDRDRRIVRFIQERTLADGSPPSIEEIRAAVGMRSTSGLRDRLVRLRRHGVVDWQEYKARTVRVI